MKKLIPAYVRVPVLFALVFMALEYFIDSGDKPAFIKYPMVSVFLFVFLFLQIAIEIVISAIDRVTYAMLTEEQKQKLAAAETSFSLKNSKLYKMLTRSKSIEQEGEIMMDHDYDGIKELDNVLPPWWVGLFYATIIFAIVYLVRFHILDGNDQIEEFEIEMAEAKKEVDAYKATAKDLIDAESVTLLTDDADLAQGKTIFENTCAACHRADGGGGIGPNLTDKYWILGGGIKNVFHTISEGGRDGKGMVAWKATLRPNEIQSVASYVLSLQGTNPADAKAPEGEIWVDKNAEATDADAGEATDAAEGSEQTEETTGVAEGTPEVAAN